MPHLSVQGTNAAERWRRLLREGERVVLGRAPHTWQIPWERFLSSEHIELVWQGGLLKVRRLPEARNPVFCHGRAAEDFQIRPGDHFVIGETVVTVTLDEERTVEQAPEPIQMHAFGAEELKRIRYGDAPHKLA